jgi:hypothetical protein
MKRRNVFVFALSLFASGCCCNPVTPGRIRREIKATGATATVNRLWARVGRSDWDLVIEQIAMGKPEWLALVPEIKPGTDAGATEDLILALSEALPKNTSGVLKLIGTDPILSYDQICKSPVMEGGTMDEVREYLASAQAALENLKDPSVEDRRMKCLAEIKKGMRRVK